LLDAYIADQMKVSKKPNAAVHLLFDILYEKYKPKISYTLTIPTNLTNIHHHLTVDEEENENVIVDEQNNDDMKLSEENFVVPVNKKQGHQKCQSDISGII
jgi:hypothetical protein